MRAQPAAQAVLPNDGGALTVIVLNRGFASVDQTVALSAYNAPTITPREMAKWLYGVSASTLNRVWLLWTCMSPCKGHL